MSRMSFGVVLIAIGLVVAALAALADQIGLGGADSFGWKQIAGLMVGVVVADLGFLVVWREQKARKSAQDHG